MDRSGTNPKPSLKGQLARGIRTGDDVVDRLLDEGGGLEERLALGVDLEAVDRQGRTPLLAVVHQENTDSVRLLVAYGANVTAVDHEGDSAEALALTARNPAPLLQALTSHH